MSDTKKYTKESDKFGQCELFINLNNAHRVIYITFIIYFLCFSTLYKYINSAILQKV